VLLCLGVGGERIYRIKRIYYSRTKRIRRKSYHNQVNAVNEYRSPNLYYYIGYLCAAEQPRLSVSRIFLDDVLSISLAISNCDQ